MSEDATGGAMIRRTPAATSDPRPARTRAAIAQAAYELSRTDAELSVTALVKAAGISRASFYAHYASLDELALTLTRDAFTTIEELWAHDPDEPAVAMRRSQERLVAHYIDNRALYTAVAALPVSKETHLASIRSMASVMEPTLATHPARPADLDAAATARYIAGAAYGLIDAWLTGDVELGDAELVEHLTRLLPPWFSGIR